MPKQPHICRMLCRGLELGALRWAVANKPALVQLNINGNFISGEGIDEVKEILKAGKKSLDVLWGLPR